MKTLYLDNIIKGVGPGTIGYSKEQMDERYGYKIGDIFQTTSKMNPKYSFGYGEWELEVGLLRGITNGDSLEIIGSEYIHLEDENTPNHDHFAGTLAIAPHDHNLSDHRHEINGTVIHGHELDKTTGALKVKSGPYYAYSSEYIGVKQAANGLQVRSTVYSLEGQMEESTIHLLDAVNTPILGSTGIAGQGKAIPYCPESTTIYQWRRIA